MRTYRCYINKTQVGTVEAEGSLEAREKAKQIFGDKAESEWNAQKIMKSNYK